MSTKTDIKEIEKLLKKLGFESSSIPTSNNLVYSKEEVIIIIRR